MKSTRFPLDPIRICAWLGFCFLFVGCATPPSGKVWVHETRSPSQMEEHLHGCKVNTFFLWPFEWASKCMRRRGYELRDIDPSKSEQMNSPNSSADNNSR